MARHFRWLVTPRVLLFVAALALLTYVAYKEYQIQKIAGCWDCGWETRHAFYLALAVAGLLIARWWTLSLSLLLALKVLYVMGHDTFWNNRVETHGVWPIVKSSLQWSADTHLEFFVLLVVATIVICYDALLLRRLVSS